jgi:hypothetical protein
LLEKTEGNSLVDLFFLSLPFANLSSMMASSQPPFLRYAHQKRPGGNRKEK